MAVSTKRRRAHVVLSDELLQKIDERVGPRHRSEFIQEAVEEKIRQLELVEAFRQFAGSIKDGEVPEWDTPESTAKWIDEIRGRCKPDQAPFPQLPPGERASPLPDRYHRPRRRFAG